MNANPSQSEPNPFSTRYVRPGAIPYQRLDGGTIDELVDDFFGRCRGWASIIGPHGSGKSTLVADLHKAFAKRSRVFSYRFSTTDRAIQLLLDERKQWTRDCVVIVDGYEQLSRWSQWRLRSGVRRGRASLLITAHQPFEAFRVLWKTIVDEDQAKRLRDALLAPRSDLLEAIDLEVAWSAARRRYPTDLRETLMSMYDWVEDQKRKRPASRNDSRAV